MEPGLTIRVHDMENGQFVVEGDGFEAPVTVSPSEAIDLLCEEPGVPRKDLWWYGKNGRRIDAPPAIVEAMTARRLVLTDRCRLCGSKRMVDGAPCPECQPAP